MSFFRRRESSHLCLDPRSAIKASAARAKGPSFSFSLFIFLLSLSLLSFFHFRFLSFLLSFFLSSFLFLHDNNCRLFLLHLLGFPLLPSSKQASKGEKFDTASAELRRNIQIRSADFLPSYEQEYSCI